MLMKSATYASIQISGWHLLVIARLVSNKVTCPSRGVQLNAPTYAIVFGANGPTIKGSDSVTVRDEPFDKLGVNGTKQGSPEGASLWRGVGGVPQICISGQ